MTQQNKITITGSLGSGKSTVARILAKKEGTHRYSTGHALRHIAERRGMTPLELNEYAETHPEIDAEIDAIFKKLRDFKKELVVDSRLAWYFVPESFKVKFEVNPEIAAKRIMNDNRKEEQYENVEDAVKHLKSRRASEVRRFKKIYNVDIEDNENFDLVIDTSSVTPEEICEIIFDSFKKDRAGEEYKKFWFTN